MRFFKFKAGQVVYASTRKEALSISKDNQSGIDVQVSISDPDRRGALKVLGTNKDAPWVPKRRQANASHSGYCISRDEKGDFPSPWELATN